MSENPNENATSPPGGHMSGPIRLNDGQERVIDSWAAYPGAAVWGNADACRLNLRTFAREILREAASPAPAGDETRCPIDGGDTSDGACSICRITQAALLNQCHHCDERPPTDLCRWCGRRGIGQVSAPVADGTPLVTLEQLQQVDDLLRRTIRLDVCQEHPCPLCSECDQVLYGWLARALTAAPFSSGLEPRNVYITGWSEGWHAGNISVDKAPWIQDAMVAYEQSEVSALTAAPSPSVADTTVRVFLGWLSRDIPDLHHVEPATMYDSWERFRATAAMEPTPPPPSEQWDTDRRAAEPQVTDAEIRERTQWRGQYP